MRLQVGKAGAVQAGQAIELAQLNGLPGLHRAGFADLRAQKGIGPAKAAQLQAAIELGRRIASTPWKTGPPSVPGRCRQFAHVPDGGAGSGISIRDPARHAQPVLGRPLEVYHGSLNTSLIRVGELFREAIKVNAAALIVAHNHPSGDPSPSPEDVAVTRALVEAGKLLDIDVLDHLVIGRYRFVSLKERGLGFSGEPAEPWGENMKQLPPARLGLPGVGADFGVLSTCACAPVGWSAGSITAITNADVVAGWLVPTVPGRLHRQGRDL